ncbi:MAG: Fe2+ transport system protein A [Bacteroidetes bacterium]|nr:MAG: Fe2+ transport system protein A [Bacteroidota bacterium]
MAPVYDTLDNLQFGETAVIESVGNDDMSLRLLDMGCVPGEAVILEKIAPLGDPIAIQVSGSLLSMRLAEASTVRIRRTLN